MSVSPRGGRHHDNEPPDSDPQLSTEMLVILTLGGATTAIAVTNPPFGMAIGLGIGVIGLLQKIVTGRRKH